MTEALRRYLMPVFGPDDGGGAGGEVMEKDAEAGADAGDKAGNASAAGSDGAADGQRQSDGGADGAGAGKGADKGGDRPQIPDNWRDLLTGGNEDIAKLINRYGSPANVGKALLEKDRMIRESGTRTKPIDKPADTSDEKAMAEWRKSLGLPDDATGYKLPDEVTKALTDEDKPVLSSFMEYGHKHGLTQDSIAIAAGWYLESQNAAAEAQAAEDTKANDDCEDKLRSEWAGAEYKGNINLAQRFIEDKFGLPYREFSDARLPDGRRLGSIAEFVMALSDRGRETFGDAVFANTEALNRFESRKAEIKKIMNEDIDRYFRDKLDVEYADILKKEEARKQ